ncbi:MAG TPA: hypothetical protein VII94_06270 [Candidatus Saccharimonadales bacterium]
MNITEAISRSVESLRSGIAESYVKMALISEKFSPERASTIVLWAKQQIEKSKSAPTDLADDKDKS